MRYLSPPFPKHKPAKARANWCGPFPENNAAVSLADRLLQRISELVRDLRDDFDDRLQEQYRAGYTHGYQEAKHEICDD
jgi:hypothetical protein